MSRADRRRSALGLDPEQEAELAREFIERRVLARGLLELRSTPFGELPALVVSDAWRGVTGNEPAGYFFGLVPSGIVCITYPCPTVIARLLNLRPKRIYVELDLAASGATEEQIAEGLRSLFEGPGLLAAGSLRAVFGPAGTGSELATREFYTKVEARSGACPKSSCAAGEFCERPPGTCDAPNEPGTCVATGALCPAVFDPVCGCDGVTYGNDCERQSAGVSQAYPGPCNPAR